MKIAIVGIMDTNMANTVTMMIKSVLIFLPSGRPCLCPYEGSILMKVAFSFSSGVVYLPLLSVETFRLRCVIPASF
jgi:hypothetical protein